MLCLPHGQRQIVVVLLIKYCIEHKKPFLITLPIESKRFQRNKKRYLIYLSIGQMPLLFEVG